MPEPGKLGAGSALAAYGALFFGMLVIGAPAQQRGVVAGLWITEALAIALPAVFALTVAGIRLGPYLGLRPISWKHAVIAAVVAGANQPVVSFLTWLSQLALPQAWVDEFAQKQQLLDSVFRVHAVPMTITVIVAAPLGEELFFRGFALPALQKSWGVVPAVLASGALFSVLHLDRVGFVGLMEIGVLLAALRLWSGSLWAAVIGHAVNNGIAGGAFILGWEDPNVPPPPGVLALGGGLFVAGLVVLVRILRRPLPAIAEEQPRERGGGAAIAMGVAWGAAVVWGVSTIVGRLG